MFTQRAEPKPPLLPPDDVIVAIDTPEPDHLECRVDTNTRYFAGVAQLVERQPSKLNVEGSSPFARFQARD